MSQYAFPGLERHRFQHEGFQGNCRDQESPPSQQDPFRHGMHQVPERLGHTTHFDYNRQYGTFLNEKGVFLNFRTGREMVSQGRHVRTHPAMTYRSKATGTGFTFQISLQYSRMARSEEKLAHAGGIEDRHSCPAFLVAIASTTFSCSST